jgi:competence protein ComFC
MAGLLNNIKDYLFPKRCLSCRLYTESYLCRRCEKYLESYSPECFVCRKPSELWSTHKQCHRKSYLEKCMYPYVYNRPVHDVITSIKYSFISDAISVLFDRLIDSETGTCLQDYKFDLVTFVPLSKKRERWRGFNQSQLLAARIAQYLELPYCKVLTKSKETRNQAELERSDRLVNVRDSFAMRPNLPISLKKRTILIVDDVCTTGSTLNECARVIRSNTPSCRVSGLCFTRGD